MENSGSELTETELELIRLIRGKRNAEILLHIEAGKISCAEEISGTAIMTKE